MICGQMFHLGCFSSANILHTDSFHPSAAFPVFEDTNTSIT